MNFVKTVLILLPVLLLSDTLVGSYFNRRFTWIVLLSPILASVMFLTMRQIMKLKQSQSDHLNSGRSKGDTIYWLFVGVLIVSITRAGTASTLEPAVAAYECLKWLSVIALLFLASRNYSASKSVVFLILIYGVLTVNVLNLLLLALGVANLQGVESYRNLPGAALMLQLLGVDSVRTILPIGGGINSSGLQAGIGTAAGGALALHVESTVRHRVIGVGLLVVSVVCALLTDSRAALLAGVVAPLIVITCRRFIAVAAIAITLVVAALPFSVQLVLDLPEVLASGSSLYRGQDVLTGRPDIWKVITERLTSGDSATITGFGAYGHQTSGLNTQYGTLFEADWTDAGSAGSHHQWLQAILDRGYLGAGLEMGVVILVAISAASRLRESSVQVTVATLFYLLLIGATAEVVSLATPVTTLAFITIGMTGRSMGSSNSEKKRPYPAQGFHYRRADTEWVSRKSSALSRETRP